MNASAIVAVAPASTMIEPTISFSLLSPKSIVRFAPAVPAPTMVSPLLASATAWRRSVSPATGVSLRLVTA